LRTGGALQPALFRLVALLGVGAFSACTLTADLDYLQNRECPSGQKVCDDECVSKTDPQRGCANTGCTPCVLPHATANCASNGLCAIAVCTGDYKDCDRLPENGCEIDVDHDPRHCGSCTAVECVTPNAVPDCAAGRCAIRSCNDGFDDCNESPRDGCEINLQESSSHCSACDIACPPNTTCVSGQCN